MGERQDRGCPGESEGRGRLFWNSGRHILARKYAFLDIFIPVFGSGIGRETLFIFIFFKTLLLLFFDVDLTTVKLINVSITSQSCFWGRGT